MAEKFVVWTALAFKQRREILKYWTTRNGSTTYSEKLLKLIASRTKVIAANPESYKLTNYPETRISAMGHFSILYKISTDKIIVTAFWTIGKIPKSCLR